MEFPIFRKYKNNMSYFKVLSEEAFEELKKEPGGFKLYSVQAKILPDRNFIHDMIFNFEQHWDEIDEAAFVRIQQTLK